MKENLMPKAIFISVRNKSKRLPLKALLEIKGRTMVERLIDRLKLAKSTDLIILCTSINPQDDSLVEIAKKNNIEYFRGSEDDVLDRYLKAAEQFKVDLAVVALGDATFVEPEYVDKTMELLESSGADFVKSTDLPVGTFVYGLKIAAVRRVCEIKDTADTEFWGAYFVGNPLFKTADLAVEEKLRHPEIRLVVDYPEDFELIKEIYERLDKEGEIIRLKDVIKLLQDDPVLLQTNQVAKEKYEEALKVAPKPKFRNQIN
jgi:spore coat polysaccharide biosynthesis protein SpsF